MVRSHLRASAWIFSSLWSTPIGIDGDPPLPTRAQARSHAREVRQSPVGSYRERAKVDLETATLKLIEAHNRIRKEEKLSSLARSEKLQAAAVAQADDMAKAGKMSHTGSDGSSLADRVEAQAYRYRRIGENVAFGDYTIDEVMKGWMNSEVHRKNILGGYSQIGAAVVLGKDGTPYWCVTFGLPRRK